MKNRQNTPVSAYAAQIVLPLFLLWTANTPFAADTNTLSQPPVQPLVQPVVQPVVPPVVSLTAVTPKAEPVPQPLTPFKDMKAVNDFIDMMVSKHHFNRTELTTLFQEATPIPTVIDRMRKPAEAKPWGFYRQFFITEKRTNGGVEFWRQHEDALAKAEALYGVPANIIVAIIGVETSYGETTGQFKTFPCLATLAFHYPARAPFFKRELEEYLLLTRELSISPLTVEGSYAGALGKPQFMPSSYRQYAIDSGNKGYRDLLHDDTDIIYSVANFLNSHGWASGHTIALEAQIDDDVYQNLAHPGLKPTLGYRDIRHNRIETYHRMTKEDKATILRLNADNNSEYWLGLNNFYVITTYNNSENYAMAVYQLANIIAERYEQKK